MRENTNEYNLNDNYEALLIDNTGKSNDVLKRRHLWFKANGIYCRLRQSQIRDDWNPKLEPRIGIKIKKN